MRPLPACILEFQLLLIGGFYTGFRSGTATHFQPIGTRKNRYVTLFGIVESEGGIVEGEGHDPAFSRFEGDASEASERFALAWGDVRWTYS